MCADSRRSPRLTDFLPLEVLVVLPGSPLPLAGPFAGRIIDISQHGACLLMSQVMQNGFHVFHSTREKNGCMLDLRITPPDFGSYQLYAHPIWLDLFKLGEIRAFKMGVDFRGNADKKEMKALQKAIQVNQEQRASWWQIHTQQVCRK